MDKSCYLPIVLSSVFSSALVCFLASSDNEVNMPDSYCQNTGDNVYEMYTGSFDDPAYVSNTLVAVPESDISFSSSKVFSGETNKGYSLQVVVEEDGTGECRVETGKDHLDPTLVYPLK